MDEVRSRIVAMTKAGVFGDPGMWPYVRDNNGEHHLGLQFASEIEFFRIGLDRSGSAQPEECDYKEVFIAVKTQPKGGKEKAFTNSDAMFFNEVYMYQTLLQLIGAEEMFLFPRCFYAEACSENNQARDIVITEDAKPKGYLSISETILDLNHVKMALKNLGRFHGLSYKAKQKFSVSYFSKVKDLKPIKFDEEFDALLLATVQRGITPLINQEKYKNVLETVISTLKNGRTVLRSLKTPEEPFAVICHGEFHKSNILFSYDVQGEVINSIFVDLQMSLYSDPSTDISFFLYMNTSQELRDVHWKEIIDVYWDGLMSIECEPGFSYDSFMSNFERKSIYGFLPTSIFLPIMLDELEASDSIEEFLNLPLVARIQMMESMGGEQATCALSLIVKDLLDRGHIDKYLERFVNNYSSV